MVEKLEKNAIDKAMKKLPSWRLAVDSSGIERSFKFSDFRQAFAFMTEVAIWAEKLEHHPEWLNVYNHVVIRLTTHDCSGLSQKDMELAERIDEVSRQWEGK